MFILIVWNSETNNFFNVFWGKKGKKYGSWSEGGLVGKLDKVYIDQFILFLQLTCLTYTWAFSWRLTNVECIYNSSCHIFFLISWQPFLCCNGFTRNHEVLDNFTWLTTCKSYFDVVWVWGNVLVFHLCTATVVQNPFLSQFNQKMYFAVQKNHRSDANANLILIHHIWHQLLLFFFYIRI